MPKLKMSRAEFNSKVKYPVSCINAGIEGVVIVGFIVNKLGMPTDVHIVKGIGGSCDQAAIEAVKRYARFIPAKEEGDPVKVRMVLPIKFRLRSSPINSFHSNRDGFSDNWMP